MTTLDLTIRNSRTGKMERVRMEIDVEDLARQLLTRARRTKRGRAAMLYGAVKLEIVKDVDQ